MDASERNKVLGLGLLLAVALGFVGFSWWRTNRMPAAPEVPAGAVLNEDAALEMSGLSRSLEARLEEDARPLIMANWPRVVVPESIRPPVKEAVAPVVHQTVRFKGVARGGEQPLAFLDDSAAGVGDVVSGHRVLAIGAESVTLLDPEGRKIELKLGGP